MIERMCRDDNMKYLVKNCENIPLCTRKMTVAQSKQVSALEEGLETTSTKVYSVECIWNNTSGYAVEEVTLNRHCGCPHQSSRTKYPMHL